MDHPGLGRMGQGSGPWGQEQSWVELRGSSSPDPPQARPDKAQQWLGRWLPVDCRQGGPPSLSCRAQAHTSRPPACAA